MGQVHYENDKIRLSISRSLKKKLVKVQIMVYCQSTWTIWQDANENTLIMGFTDEDTFSAKITCQHEDHINKLKRVEVYKSLQRSLRKNIKWRSIKINI